MPNWIASEIKAEGLGKLNIFRRTENGITLDFDKIIPSPKTKEECPKEFLLTNEPVQPSEEKPWFNWYEWNCANWGTKWNARTWDDYETVDDEITIATAWAPPLPIFVKISEMLGDTIMTIKYHDEDDFATPIIKMEWQNGKNTRSWAADWNDNTDDFDEFKEIDPYEPS